ncbi:MAG: CBS domain-containing protein [bacterium]
MNAKTELKSATPYEDIAAAFVVRHVMTPIDEAFCVKPNETIESAVGRLNERGFDYAPVRDIDKVVGIFKTDNTPRSFVADVMQHLTPENTVDADAPLENLPMWLCQCPFQIVLSKKQVIGLVNAADLNKEPLRSFLFLHIASVERRLARLVRNEFPRDEDWLAILSVSRRKRILNIEKDMDFGDVEIDLLEHVYFSDLINIINGCSIGTIMAAELGWALSTDKDGINDLRTRICHTTKLLLRSADELSQLVESISGLHKVIEVADNMLHESTT